jgi:hypothetical protein
MDGKIVNFPGSAETIKFRFVPSSVHKSVCTFVPPAPRSALQHAQLRQIP